MNVSRNPGGGDGGSSIADASRSPMLPGWQRWGKLYRGCFVNDGIHGCFCYLIADAPATRKFQLAFMDALAIRSRRSAETKPGRQKGWSRSNWII